MSEGSGRRERKKQLTRQALIDAAVRLFTERGYDRTSVADIAEAADVSARTYFLHFPTKEDVLLADSGARIELAVQAVTDRAVGASPSTVLAGAMKAMIAHAWSGDLPAGLAALRVRLVLESPTFQARLLHVMFTGQTRIAEALHRAYPDELGEITAAALVGGVFGAVNAAAVTSLRRADPADRTRVAMQQAADVVLHGLGLDHHGRDAADHE